jgi:hypothetical protein
VNDIESHKEEMLKLFMKQNPQIMEMEAEMDKMIKEKEKNVYLAMTRVDAVPLTGIRTTKVSTSATIPTIILGTIPTGITLAIPEQISYASDKLVKSSGINA